MNLLQKLNEINPYLRLCLEGSKWLQRFDESEIQECWEQASAPYLAWFLEECGFGIDFLRDLAFICIAEVAYLADEDVLSRTLTAERWDDIPECTQYYGYSEDAASAPNDMLIYEALFYAYDMALDDTVDAILAMNEGPVWKSSMDKRLADVIRENVTLEFVRGGYLMSSQFSKKFHRYINRI